MELEFRKPILKDKDSFNKILHTTKNLNSESAFGTYYIWSDVYNINVCLLDDIIFKVINNNGILRYEFPRGANTPEKINYAIQLMKDDCAKRNLDSFKFTELLESEVSTLENIFPNEFYFESSRDNFEYIYDISDLAYLKGKKYHGKRNHISKFSKQYNWNYIPISNENKSQCLEVSEKWLLSHIDTSNIDSLKEYSALKRAIESYDCLDLTGGMIKIKDKIVAFTIGEKINERAILVHFEKASPEFQESYSIINNEFCKRQVDKFKLINREEDMGIPGLRKSKLSYKPKLLLKKYNARLES